MYGKIFSKLYQGSMVGSGSHVFAVWGYCIACADPEDHTVELNPVLLATIIGDSRERIEAAISFLCAEDPNSHCQEHGGARLVKQGGFRYFLTTHEEYREMKSNDELRAYFREAQRKHREKRVCQRQSKTVKDCLELSSFPASASASAFVEKGDARGKNKKRSNHSLVIKEVVDIWASTFGHPPLDTANLKKNLLTYVKSFSVDDLVAAIHRAKAGQQTPNAAFFCLDWLVSNPVNVEKVLKGMLDKPWDKDTSWCKDRAAQQNVSDRDFYPPDNINHPDHPQYTPPEKEKKVEVTP